MKDFFHSLKLFQQKFMRHCWNTRHKFNPWVSQTWIIRFLAPCTPQKSLHQRTGSTTRWGNANSNFSVDFLKFKPVPGRIWPFQKDNALQMHNFFKPSISAIFLFNEWKFLCGCINLCWAGLNTTHVPSYVFCLWPTMGLAQELKCILFEVYQFQRHSKIKLAICIKKDIHIRCGSTKIG